MEPGRGAIVSSEQPPPSERQAKPRRRAVTDHPPSTSHLAPATERASTLLSWETSPPVPHLVTGLASRRRQGVLWRRVLFMGPGTSPPVQVNERPFVQVGDVSWKSRPGSPPDRRNEVGTGSDRGVNRPVFGRLRYSPRARSGGEGGTSGRIRRRGCGGGSARWRRGDPGLRLC